MQTQHIIIGAIVLGVVLLAVLFAPSTDLPELGTEPGANVERRAVEDYSGLDAIAFQSLGTGVVGDCRIVVPENFINGTQEGARWIGDALLLDQVTRCIDLIPDVEYLEAYVGRGELVYFFIAYQGVIEDFGPVLRFKLNLVASGPTRYLGMTDTFSIYLIAKED